MALIDFARGHDATPTSVTLIDQQTTFRAGREIAWRVELPPADSGDVLRVTVTNEETGQLEVDEDFTPTAGSNVFYGQTLLTSEPGRYVMRYYDGAVLVGEGSFTVREAPRATPKATPKPTPRATPKPTPKPTKKPRGGGSCDPSYPTVCIAPYPPDLDCGDIPHRRFKVRGADDHGFDGDNDGIGCESG